MCPGLAQSTRGDVLYMWIYIHQHIFISHTPSELNLSQIASAALWFMAYWGGIFPPSSETHVNKWAEVSRVTRGRTSPSSIQKDEKRKWAWCNIRCHVQQKTTMHTHTHSNITECQRRVSVSTSGWGKEITLPVAQILNEWKFDWNDFPICVCLSRLAHLEYQHRTAPHTLFMSRAAERGAELQITERRLKTKCSWATSTGRESCHWFL